MGAVIFILNLNKIKETKKVIPYSWNYMINKDKSDHKKEKEEFIQLGIVKHSCKMKDNKEFKKELEELFLMKDKMEEDEFNRLLDFYKKEAEKYDVYMLKQPLGELYLDNILEGIILNLSSLEFFRDIEYYKEILNHNKFLGFLSSKDEF